MSTMNNCRVGPVGFVGLILMFVGSLQLGGGVYFIIPHPVFCIASNIWTGIITLLTGLILMYIGCIYQTIKRIYLLISFCVVSLVANVANIAINQVGKKILLLNEQETLDHEHSLLTIEIGFWLTTGLSALVILSSLVLANYLFFNQIKGKFHKVFSPISKFNSQERLEQNIGPNKNRFFPPSRLVNSKVGCVEELSASMWIPFQGLTNNWLESPTSTLDISRNVGGGISTEPGDSSYVNNSFEVSHANFLSNNDLGNDFEQKEQQIFTIEMNPININSNNITRNSHSDLSNFKRVDLENDNRFSTFRSKSRASRTSCQPIKNAVQPHVNRPNSDISTYIQSHPKSWMFLIPSVFTQITDLPIWDPNAEKDDQITFINKPMTNLENKLQRAIEESNTILKESEISNNAAVNSSDNKCCSIIDECESKNQSEKLKKQNSSTNLRLKRPKEKPPMPPISTSAKLNDA